MNPEKGEHAKHRMKVKPASTEDRHAPGLYDIRIKGYLDDRWATGFEGLTLTRDADGNTRMFGPVVDQAALHSLLRKVRDLGLPLVAVIRLEPGRGGDPAVPPRPKSDSIEKADDP